MKEKMKAFKVVAGSVAGKARSASPFKKMFISADDNAKLPHVAAEEDARMEISQCGDRDEFEEARDMYDPEEGESRTLNTLSRSLSLESGTFDDESLLGSLLSGTVGEGGEDEESLGSYDAPKQTMPQRGKVFTKSVVLSNLNNGANVGDSLVLRAQHRCMKPDEESHVLINVRASSVSPFDVVKCRGVGVTKEMLPYTPGQVVVGTIEALGSEVKLPFQIGDRVVGFVGQGGNARFMSTEADNLVKASPNIKNSEAACLVEDWMSAYRALRIAKNVFKGAALFGMNVFITDGFSPIGQAAINLADLEGANIYCCARKSQHKHLKSLSSRIEVFEPHIDKWLPDIMEKMDIVIDNTCVDGYASSWQALNDKGILVCLATAHMGYSTRGCGVIDMDEMLRTYSQMKAKYTMSQTVFLDIRQDFKQNRIEFTRDLMYLMFLVEQGKIHPKVGEKVALDDVGDAQKLLANGKNNGTIVCLPWKKC